MWKPIWYSDQITKPSHFIPTGNNRTRDVFPRILFLFTCLFSVVFTKLFYYYAENILIFCSCSSNSFVRDSMGEQRASTAHSKMKGWRVFYCAYWLLWLHLDDHCCASYLYDRQLPLRHWLGIIYCHCTLYSSILYLSGLDFIIFHAQVHNIICCYGTLNQYIIIAVPPLRTMYNQPWDYCLFLDLIVHHVHKDLYTGM